jgi:hypothetical protein
MRGKEEVTKLERKRIETVLMHSILVLEISLFSLDSVDTAEGVYYSIYYSSSLC